MKAPTKREVFYPEPKAIELEAPPRIWSRYRIVIPCFDETQASGISEKVASICGHTVEQIWCATDDEGSQSLGEIVMARRIVPVIGEMLIESEVEPMPA